MPWEKKTERLTIRLTETERKEIESRAARFGLESMSMNFIVHRMILAGLRSQSGTRPLSSAGDFPASPGS